jgi:hypothetical protein
MKNENENYDAANEFAPFTSSYEEAQLARAIVIAPAQAVPDVAISAPTVAAELEELPSCLAKSIVLLQQARALPQSLSNAAKVKRIERHVSAIQQGASTLPPITADQQATMRPRYDRLRDRLEELAALHPSIRKQLEAHDRQ